MKRRNLFAALASALAGVGLSKAYDRQAVMVVDLYRYVEIGAGWDRWAGVLRPSAMTLGRWAPARDAAEATWLDGQVEKTRHLVDTTNTSDRDSVVWWEKRTVTEDELKKIQSGTVFKICDFKANARPVSRRSRS